MILVDTGPLVALFAVKEADHQRCLDTLKALRDPLRTTIPVLTEVFHLLGPATPGADGVRQMVIDGVLAVWWLDPKTLGRAFELMELYKDHPMDLADASLVVAAEELDARKIFTLDRGHFGAYRVRRGHKLHALEIVPK